MENASKAIIIAGAVIIVLMIISLSVYFYYQSTDVVDMFGRKISATEIKNHNNSFLVYDGELVGVEVVNACIRVKEYNDNARMPVTITCTPKNVAYTIGYQNLSNYQSIINNVERTRVYKSRVVYNDKGIIDNIIIEPKR